MRECVPVAAAAQPPLDAAGKVDEELGTGVAPVNVRVARLSLANKLSGNWKQLEQALRQADVIGIGKVRSFSSSFL